MSETMGINSDDFELHQSGILFAVNINKNVNIVEGENMNFRRASAGIAKLILVIGFSLMMLSPAVADPYSIVADITADNHYGLFFGNAAGTNLTFVGRNEPDDNGSGLSGGCGWSEPENWKINAPHGSYLYVLAWDAGSYSDNDDGSRTWNTSPQMCIGQVKKASG